VTSSLKPDIIDLTFQLSFDVLEPVDDPQAYRNNTLYTPCRELREWCHDNLSEPVIYTMGRMRYYATVGNDMDAVHFKLRWGDWCVFNAR